MCKNLTKIVDMFLSFQSWLRGMNLVIVLPRIQVSFECYDVIQISYMEKTFWWVYRRTNVRDVSTSLEKNKLERGALCEKGLTVEVTTGMISRVILAAQSQKEKIIWWQKKKKKYYWIQTNFSFFLFLNPKSIYNFSSCKLFGEIFWRPWR